MFSESFSSMYYNTELSPVLARSKEGYKNIKRASKSSEIVIFILLLNFLDKVCNEYWDSLFG